MVESAVSLGCGTISTGAHFLPGICVAQRQSMEYARGQYFRLAAAAGFTTIDFHDWFNNQNIRSVTVAEWNWHSNAKGQKVIADKLCRALRDQFL